MEQKVQRVPDCHRRSTASWMCSWGVAHLARRGSAGWRWCRCRGLGRGGGRLAWLGLRDSLTMEARGAGGAEALLPDHKAAVAGEVGERGEGGRWEGEGGGVGRWMGREGRGRTEDREGGKYGGGTGSNMRR